MKKISLSLLVLSLTAPMVPAAITVTVTDHHDGIRVTVTGSISLTAVGGATSQTFSGGTSLQVLGGASNVGFLDGGQIVSKSGASSENVSNNLGVYSGGFDNAFNAGFAPVNGVLESGPETSVTATDGGASNPSQGRIQVTPNRMDNPGVTDSVIFFAGYSFAAQNISPNQSQTLSFGSDFVRFETGPAIPEPSSSLLASIAMISMVTRRRRQ